MPHDAGEWEAWADVPLFTHDAYPAADMPLTAEVAAMFIRAAYAHGYTDALRDPAPLPVEKARVGYARLRLAIPE